MQDAVVLAAVDEVLAACRALHKTVMVYVGDVQESGEFISICVALYRELRPRNDPEFDAKDSRSFPPL